MNAAELMKYNAKLSKVVDTMRLPLIYLVVIAHLVPFALPKVTFSPDSNELYILTSEMFSHHIAKLSVRCYFLVSGYYFFTHYYGDLKAFLKRQYKSRFRTLLIPFLIWNAIMMIAVILKNYLFKTVGLSLEEGFVFYRDTSIYQMFFAGPVNFPLWFVRDLICMIIISPLILYYIKYLKLFGIILLAILYLSIVGNEIPGFSLTAIFFFSFGAYFSLEKKNLLLFFEKIKSPAYIISLIFLFLSLKNNHEVFHEYYLRVFILFAVVSIFNLFSLFNDKYVFMNRLTGFSSLSFFIYVIHEIYIINWLKGYFYNLTIYETGWMKFIAFFIIPILCILICYGVYHLMMKVAPKLFVVSLGGRIPKYNRFEQKSSLQANELEKVPIN